MSYLVNNIVENYNDYSADETKKEGSSPLIKLLFFLAILLYLYSILFGEYSIGVMLDAKKKKERLLEEYNTLQSENQKLQKKHFEMIQLTPTEDSF